MFVKNVEGHTLLQSKSGDFVVRIVENVLKIKGGLRKMAMRLKDLNSIKNFTR